MIEISSYTGRAITYNNQYMIYWMTIIIGVAIVGIATYGVRKALKEYSKVRSSIGLTGEQVARKILDNNGLHNVKVERVRGSFSDHFNPKTNVVALSESVFSSISVSAVSVAAHECGHAIQHATGYGFLKFRSALFPLARFSSQIVGFTMIMAIITENIGLINVSIILYLATFLFSVITLPVEFNASTRAKQELQEIFFIDSNEIKGTEKVLKAAAFTYVATAAASLLQIVRLLILRNSRR